MNTKKARSYSRDFTPRAGARRCAIMIDKIPPTLYDALRAKAKREGVALRSLLLQFLTDWLRRP